MDFIRKNKLPILLGVLILVLFLGTDIFYWWHFDNFKSPIRHITGDTSLYVYQLNSVVQNDKPAGSPYFWENKYELGRFYVFGKLLSLIPFLKEVSTIWLSLILRGLVPLLVFFLFSALLRQHGVENKLSHYLAFIFIALYGPMTFKGGSALTNWFLPAFLLGIYILIKFFKSTEVNWKNFLAIIVSVVLFSFHPIYFAVGMSIASIFWLVKLKNNRNPSSLIGFGNWLLFGLIHFFFIFLPFIYTTDPIFAQIAKDMSYRNTLLETRFPFLFLFGLRYLMLMITCLTLYHRVKEKGKLKNSLLVFLVISAVAFIGLNSYIITGKYFLNDHFPFVEDFIAIPLAIFLIFKFPLSREKFFRILAITFGIVTILSIGVIVYYHNFKPVYAGRWGPLFLSYIFITALLWQPQLKEKLLKHGRFILIFLFSFALAHAIFMNYWDERYWYPLHANTQKFRQAIDKINSLPKGVIMANPYLTNLVLIYSGHKAYWSPIALHDAVSTGELYQRWLDAKLFFPEEPVFKNRSAVYSVYGARDNKCHEFKRYVYLNFLAKVGIDFPKKAICDDSIYSEFWPLMEVEAKNHLDKNIKTLAPYYKLDYLVIENDKDLIISKLINDNFTEIYSDNLISILTFNRPTFFRSETWD